METSKSYPIYVVLVLQHIDQTDILSMRTGFIRKANGGLYLPEEPLHESKRASEQILQMAGRFINVNPKWATRQFIGFFDSLHATDESPRCIRIVYKLSVPINIEVSQDLEWKTHHELATTFDRAIGDHHRIYTATFNS